MVRVVVMDNEPTAALFVGFDFNHTAYAFSQLAFEPPDIRVIGSDDLASFRAGFLLADPFFCVAYRVAFGLYQSHQVFLARGR